MGDGRRQSVRANTLTAVRRWYVDVRRVVATGQVVGIDWLHEIGAEHEPVACDLDRALRGIPHESREPARAAWESMLGVTSGTIEDVAETFRAREAIRRGEVHS